MSSLILTGGTSGAGTLNVPAIAGTFTATIGSATGTHYPFTSGNEVASTSGTSIDFISIPSWVKRITVMFNGVSTSGINPLQLQIGAGSLTTSGYKGSSTGGSGAVGTRDSSTGFVVTYTNIAANLYSGIATLATLGNNIWVESGTMGASPIGVFSISGGGLTLGGTLDRLRVTTVGSTDTFDAGSINILYE